VLQRTLGTFYALTYHRGAAPLNTALDRKSNDRAMAAVVTDPTLTHSPPRWAECEAQLAKGATPSAFGFSGTVGDLRRFARRYRFAKALKSVSLDTYHESTENGYTALLRVFLMWGAFEQYLRLLGITDQEKSALPGFVWALYRSPSTR
jgi:hypothetical protein